MQPDDIKAQTQARFGQHAGAYVTSAIHAGGPDLELLLELAAPQPDARVLDIAMQRPFWGQIFAFSAMITLPILVIFLAFQKQFVQSVAMSGIKG